MSKNREVKNLIVGLDIGTSKIVTIVAEVKPEGTLEVIGVGMHESSGMKKGMVVNIDATVAAIQRSLEEAEAPANRPAGWDRATRAHREPDDRLR